MTMHNVRRDAAKESGHQKVGERTSLLWKSSEKKGTCKTCFDEDLAGQVYKQSRRAERLVGRKGSVSRRCLGYNKRKPKEQQRAIRRVAFWKILKSVHRPDCPPACAVRKWKKSVVKQKTLRVKHALCLWR